MFWLCCADAVSNDFHTEQQLAEDPFLAGSRRFPVVKAERIINREGSSDDFDGEGTIEEEASCAHRETATSAMSNTCLGSTSSSRTSETEDPGIPPLDLAPREAAALEKLKSELSADEEETMMFWLVSGEPFDLCLYRFLENYDFKVKDALKALRADWKWRQQVDINGIAETRVEDVVGCELQMILDYMPTWLQGYDKLGRPVIVSAYGKFQFPPMLKVTDVEHLIKFHIHNSERIARLIGQQAAKLHENLTSVCTIVDAKGLDPANLSIAKCIQWAKGMAEVDYLHYPGRLGHMFIINSPSIVQKIWSLIQFTLSEKQRKSIHIYSDRSQWEPVLMSYIDADQLPPEYGGCAPNRALEGIPLAR